MCSTKGVIDKTEETQAWTGGLYMKILIYTISIMGSVVL